MKTLKRFINWIKKINYEFENSKYPCKFDKNYELYKALERRFKR